MNGNDDDVNKNNYSSFFEFLHWPGAFPLLPQISATTLKG
jgi:hypothetical protein